MTGRVVCGLEAIYGLRVLKKRKKKKKRIIIKTAKSDKGVSN